MGYGTQFGYGEGGYGSSTPIIPVISRIIGCTPLLRQFTSVEVSGSGYGAGGYGGGTYGGGFTSHLGTPTNNFWAMSVDDVGDLTLTSVNFVPSRHNPPVLNVADKAFRLDVDETEAIVVRQIVPGTVPVSFDYIPLNSPNFLPYKLTVDQSGELTITQTAALLPDMIPYPDDVRMSVYGDAPPLTPLICISCGNASVTASADLSLWCCTCSSFVTPEDTNIIVVLDE